MTDLSESDSYFKAVFDLIRSDLASVLGEADGKEAFSAFYTVVKKSFDMNGMPEDLLDQFRATGMTIQESALAILDASVTEVKRWTAGVGDRPGLAEVTGLLETAIDRIFLANIGRIVPRNGRMGQELNDFTREA